MHRIERAAPTLRTCVAVVTAAVVAALLLGPASSAAATPEPTPTPAKSGPSLPINLKLGILKVDLDVPLTLQGLLGTLATPTTPPPITSRPQPPPTTRPHSTPTTSAAPGSSAHGSGAAGQHAQIDGQSATRPAQIRHANVHRSQSRTSTSPPRHRKSTAPGALIVAQRLLSGTGPRILIALLIVTALGVAFVVRLNSRRGDHSS